MHQFEDTHKQVLKIINQFILARYEYRKKLCPQKLLAPTASNKSN